VNLGYHENNQQSQCCLDVSKIVDYELLPPKKCLVHSFVVIEHKYTSFEMGESEFRWRATILR